MRYYELLYIVNSNFERKRFDEAMNEIDSRLKKTKSKIINHIIWGKKKLAYPIRGNKYGTYVLVHYLGGDKNKLNEFDSWLKLSDLVIRHMIVRLKKEPNVIEKVEDEKVDDEKVEDEKVDDEKVDDEKVDDEKVEDEKEISNENNDVENQEVK